MIMLQAIDISASREYEMQIYLDSTKAMYDSALAQNGEIYDIAFDLTSSFRDISSAAVLEDSRLIKILRYAVAPSISQMKFGQLFGLASIDRLEKDRLSIGSAKYQQLRAISDKISEFASKNLDQSRFIWLNNPTLATSLAYDYAKKWTCSIAADQNAQTAYRNWRKAQQEQAIAAKLISLGYVKSGFCGVIEKSTDINIGEYTQEIKVKGRTTQKADVAFRSKKTKKLVLVEAKAVGVEIDVTKRIKECCDKANDWSANQHLQEPEVVAVIASFFTLRNLENLAASNVYIVWEHCLARIEEKA